MAGLSIMRGKETMPIKVVHSGDIGIVAKLTSTTTGDTLCDKAHPLTLPMPAYPHALFRVAINPKTQADAAKISPTLTRLCEEDMTLSWYQEKPPARPSCRVWVTSISMWPSAGPKANSRSA